ncbi:MAG: molybdopterin-dependent oxidoreductase, partial [Thermodesulfovibrionales bacterium]
LNLAGIKPGSVEVTFDGLDSVVMPSVPDFIKSLPLDKALEDDIILAYEINGKPLPLLNGYPLRLIVPGWYATYWVKSLTEIRVIDKSFDGFWMKPAYRIPDNPCGCVEPGTSPKKTIPINRMTTRSLIIEPESGSELKAGIGVRISGIAFSGGYSIKDVIVSTDNGKTWHQAELIKDMGRYSWIQWYYNWRPSKPGRHILVARATNSIGESQPFESLWNPPGYLWNKIERVEVTVK